MPSGTVRTVPLRQAALGLIALEATPYTHMQPAAFIEGQKGCGGCHTLGLKDQKVRESDKR